MSLFLIAAFILVIAFMAILALRRKRKPASRSGRYRSPMGGGLMLDRPGARKRNSLAGFTPQPRHIFLGLVLVVMTFWLGAGYFLAGGEGSALVAESRADAALPEQFSYLGGRLTPASSVEAAASGLGPVAVGPDTAPAASVQPGGQGKSSILMAAHSVLPTESRLDQVGLLPAKVYASKESSTAAKAAKTAANTSAPASSKAGQAALAPQPAAKSAAAAKSEPSSSSAKAAPASPAKPKLATAKASGQKGLLAASRQYTVHLGSFGEKGNADQYLAQLLNAGEQEAFISESTVDGRLWHRVMSGRFPSRDEAENYGRNLKKRGLTVETGRYLVKSID